MSELADAIKALEDEAQSLRDNLPNLSDPPNAEEFKVVSAFTEGIQKRLDRLRELIVGSP